MTAFATRLSALLPPERLLWEPAQLAAYQSDALTAYRAEPVAIAIPETADEVIALVRFCCQEKILSWPAVAGPAYPVVLCP